VVVSREVPRGGLLYFNQLNDYAKVGQSIFPHDHYAFWRECPNCPKMLIGPEGGSRRRLGKISFPPPDQPLAERSPAYVHRWPFFGGTPEIKKA
jgi:hypothetical protein